MENSIQNVALFEWLTDKDETEHQTLEEASEGFLTLRVPGNSTLSREIRALGKRPSCCCGGKTLPSSGLWTGSLHDLVHTSDEQ